MVISSCLASVSYIAIKRAKLPTLIMEMCTQEMFGILTCTDNVPDNMSSTAQKYLHCNSPSVLGSFQKGNRYYEQ